MSVPDQLAAIHKRALALVEDQYQLLNQLVFPALAAQGIQFVNAKTATAKQREWLARLLRERSRAGADAARPGSRAAVPAHPEQEPELHRAPVGQGCVRPRRGARRRAGAALAAAHHPPAAVGSASEQTHFVFLSTVISTFVAQLFSGMKVRRRLAVPRHAQQRSVRRRRRSRQPAARRRRRARAAPLRRRRAPGDFARLSAGHRRLPAASLRARARTICTRSTAR